MSLAAYKKKRNFKLTDEPSAEKRVAGSKAGARFVIQKHDASRLHYDFRLEMGGTLKSWAVPKGLPAAKGERRLAVHVEDHPLAYGEFEGTIPKGQYGGGTVMLWDRGTWEPLSKTPARDLAGGKLHFLLHGEKLEGEWYLVRLRDEKQWLIIKGGEDIKPVTKKLDDTSVLSGKSMAQIAGKTRVSKSRRGAVKSMRAVAKPRSTKVSAALPIPKFVQPMKAKLAAHAPPGEWLYEIKFDGWRALALKADNKVQILSRNEKDLGAKFPEIAEAVAGLKSVSEAILDGEIVAIDEAGRSSFQLLQAYDLGEKRPPIVYYVFDALQLNGSDLTRLPLSERRAALEKTLGKSGGVIRFSAALGYNAKVLLKKARELGLEGLIGKRPDSVYEAGLRSGAWIKLKLHHEQEFVIGGYTDPEGSRHAFGSVLVGCYKGRELRLAGKVGTGFNTTLLRSLHARFKKIATETCPFSGLPEPRSGKWGQGITAAEMKRCHWVKPVLVCQVKFSEWTRDGRLRQPVFLGLREDKNAAEVRRETPS